MDPSDFSTNAEVTASGLVRSGPASADNEQCTRLLPWISSPLASCGFQQVDAPFSSLIPHRLTMHCRPGRRVVLSSAFQAELMGDALPRRASALLAVERTAARLVAACMFTFTACSCHQAHAMSDTYPRVKLYRFWDTPVPVVSQAGRQSSH